MERCPICRAPLKESIVCHCCGTDLLLVIAMEKKAHRFFNHALQNMMNHNWDHAKKNINQALLIHYQPVYQHLFDFIVHHVDADDKSN
jgi:hypothetical protein